ILVLEQDEEAADKVANQVLSTKADCQASDSSACDEGSCVDSKNAENCQPCYQNDDDLRDTLEDTRKSYGTLFALIRREWIIVPNKLYQSIGEDADGANEQPASDENKHDLQCLIRFVFDEKEKIL